MHLRKLVLACGFASLALSNFASALGLGEVKLKSTLNQPLEAEVQLLDTRDLSAEQIIIALASPADFERNGVERLYFYTQFQFQVVLDHPGGPIVKITSRAPVREPYLNFLIEARWTAGRLLREYTLLVDLPTFEESTPRAVQAPESKPAPAAKQPTKPAAKVAPAVTAPETTSEIASPATESKSTPAPEAEQAKPSKKFESSTGTYGPIGSNETLWEIAKSVRPDGSVTVHQTMLALQRLNPQAFINNNINLIKKGQVLRVPDTKEITSVSKSEAVNQVVAQNNDWSHATPPTTSTGLEAQLDASHHTNSGHRQTEIMAGRVKLESPSAANTAANGQGSGANKGSGKALEKELAATLEELDKTKSEKTELSSRVHALEEQTKTMQRLLDVSNEKLRALQLQASKQPEKTNPVEKVAEKPAEVKLPEPVASSAAPAAVSAAPTSVAAESAVASSEAVVSSQAASSAAPVKKEPAKIVPKVEEKKTLFDQLLDNLLWVALGAVALAGAGVYVMRRRMQQIEQEAARQAEAEDMFASEPDFQAFNEPPEDFAQDELDIETPPEEPEEDTAAVAETGDVVGEADIYIAYGKFDQAEEMLLNGLNNDPQSTDIRLKLLEVYSQTQDVTNFDKHYSAILPVASSFALNRAAELRAGIPGAAPFDRGDDITRIAPPKAAPQVSAPQAEEELDLDFDDEPAPSASLDDDNDLSFDLDLDDDDHKKIEATAPVSRYDLDFGVEEDTNLKAVKLDKDDDDDFALDFDLEDELDLKDEDLPDTEAEADADDLSAISLALSDLDTEIEADELEAATLDASDEEFKFELNDVDDTDELVVEEDALDEEALAQEDLDEETLTDEELVLEDDDSFAETALADDSGADEAVFEEEPLEEVAETESDDFNLEMDVGAVDLAALDHEMESLDMDGLDIEAMDAEFPDDADDLLEAPAEDDIENDEDVAPEALVDESLDLDDDLLALDDDESAVEAPVALAEEAAEEMADDEVFDHALSDFSAESLAMDQTDDLSDDDLDSEFDFMADADETATKLDLARAYIDMGDSEGARDILSEVAQEGNDDQRKEAADLLSRIDA